MADVTLNVLIKDAYVLRVLDAVKSRFIKDDAESNKQFVERVLKEYLKEIVHNYELRKDQERFNTEMAAIKQPNANVPADIVE